MPLHLHFCRPVRAENSIKPVHYATVSRPRHREPVHTTISAKDAMVSSDKNSAAVIVTELVRSPIHFFHRRAADKCYSGHRRLRARSRSRVNVLLARILPFGASSMWQSTPPMKHRGPLNLRYVSRCRYPRNNARSARSGYPTLREMLDTSTSRDRLTGSQPARSASPYSPSGTLPSRSSSSSRWRSWTRRILPEMVLGSSANSNRRTRL